MCKFICIFQKKFVTLHPNFVARMCTNSIFNTFVSIKYWFCTGFVLVLCCSEFAARYLTHTVILGNNMKNV